MSDEALVTMERLDDQIEWYDSKSQSNQKLFKLVKALQLAAAAGIPVVAALDGEIPNWVFAALGGLVLILEGVQQLYQYQQNWINYRSTCEALNPQPRNKLVWHEARQTRGEGRKGRDLHGVISLKQNGLT